MTVKVNEDMACQCWSRGTPTVHLAQYLPFPHQSLVEKAFLEELQKPVTAEKEDFNINAHGFGMGRSTLRGPYTFGHIVYNKQSP